MIEDSPSLPHPLRSGRQSLKPILGELARSMDRFLGRTESEIISALLPGSAMKTPVFQPQHLAGFFVGTISSHLERAFERNLRAWLALALRLGGEKEPVLLERPLRDLFTQLRPFGGEIEGEVARLQCALTHTALWRLPLAGRKDAAVQWQKAVAAVVLALLSAATRRSHATLPAAQLLQAAQRLVEEWDALENDLGDQPRLASALKQKASMI
jgi:hypothetical protein